MKKTVTAIVVVLVFAALLMCIALFGFQLGAINIPEVSTGIKLGLDLVGGSEIVYEAEIPEGMSSSEIEDGMDTAQTMLRQRLTNLGYTEANVYLSGQRRIAVEIPNVSDPEEAVQMLGTTAVIEFRDSDGKVVLEGSDITSASATYAALDELSAPEYFVSLKLSQEGYEKFVSATTEISRKPEGENYLAIMMDDDEISAPRVSETIDTDTPIITLGADAGVDYAKYLAEIISAGQLPFALRETKLQSVGSSLGEKALESSLIAGLIGIILVMVYMIAVYRIPGVVADIALLLYIALFMVCMSAFGINLSLPGIAGILLTIGMAVDANIIIYERLIEELNSGKTLRSAVNSGFKRAYTAIIDSNVTTIIAALVLLAFGTGTIVGFAKTLLMGVILSMICMLIIPNAILKSLSNISFKSYKGFGAKGGTR